MDPTHIRHPSFAGCSALIKGIGVIKALDVLLFELILRSPQRGVSLLPEGFHKNIPVPFTGQLQKDLPLDGKNDIAHELQPVLVCLGQVPFLDGLNGDGSFFLAALWQRESDRIQKGRKNHKPDKKKSESSFHPCLILLLLLLMPLTLSNRTGFCPIERGTH